ncbi:MAG: AcvB/VirJ family lysyl-phosphatidylglycerol hydrolase [Rhodanobacter sp.]
MLAGLAACVLGLGVIWNPFAHVPLEKVTVVLPAAAGVAPPPGSGDLLTVIYSGDGGWADLDQQLGGAFAAHGLPVLGVNLFKYYWRMRSGDESAAQLDALLTKYLEKLHKRRIWLVGYSFGADVLPSIVGKLSSENRARITQLVLLSPSRDYSYEIQFEGYMIARGRIKAIVKQFLELFNKVPAYPSLPALAALQHQFPVVCYYGRDDADDSLCTLPDLPPWVQVDAKNGDHHFDGGYQPLAAQLLGELPAHASTAAAGQ